MKAERLTLAAILRMKYNVNCSGVSSRILIGLSESVLLFSLLSYMLDMSLQLLATLWVVSGLSLAQLSRFPTSHLLMMPIKRVRTALPLLLLALSAQRCHSLWEKHDLYHVPWVNVPLWRMLHWDAGRMQNALVIFHPAFQQEGRWVLMPASSASGNSFPSPCTPQGIPTLSPWAQVEL